MIAADVKSFLFRPKKEDSLIGVSSETIDQLCKLTGMNKTALVHYALVRLANDYGLRELKLCQPNKN